VKKSLKNIIIRFLGVSEVIKFAGIGIPIIPKGTFIGAR